MPCALSSAFVMGGCRGLGLNGAMVPLVLCEQYVCSPEQVSLPKSRFVRIDGVARQGSDTQQCLRTSRSDVCRACPSQARREFAPHYNSSHISQEFAEGARR